MAGVTTPSAMPFILVATHYTWKELEIQGCLTVAIWYNTQTQSLPLVVVAVQGPNLLGHDRLNNIHFRLAVPSPPTSTPLGHTKDCLLPSLLWFTPRRDQAITQRANVRMYRNALVPIPVQRMRIHYSTIACMRE